MSTVVRRPLHQWTRHHPKANAIAQELLRDPAVLSLRTRSLQPAICSRFGVGACTARTAVAIARRTADKVGDSRGAHS